MISIQNSDIEFIEHECVEKFIKFYLHLSGSFDEIYDQVECLTIKKEDKKKTKIKRYQIVSFVYSKIMCFLKN